MHQLIAKRLLVTLRNEIYYSRRCDMDKYKAIPQGYMTVGEIAGKMDITTLRPLRLFLLAIIDKLVDKMYHV